MEQVDRRIRVCTKNDLAMFVIDMRYGLQKTTTKTSSKKFSRKIPAPTAINHRYHKNWTKRVLNRYRKKPLYSPCEGISFWQKVTLHACSTTFIRDILENIYWNTQSHGKNISFVSKLGKQIDLSSIIPFCIIYIQKHHIRGNPST